MAHLSLDGEPLIKPSIGKLLGLSNDKKLSRSTVFAAVYPDSDNEGTENYIEGTENYNEGTETTPEKLNSLMVNEYQILYSPHHNPHCNLSQIQILMPKVWKNLLIYYIICLH